MTYINTVTEMAIEALKFILVLVIVFIIGVLIGHVIAYINECNSVVSMPEREVQCTDIKVNDTTTGWLK